MRSVRRLSALTAACLVLGPMAISVQAQDPPTKPTPAPVRASHADGFVQKAFILKHTRALNMLAALKVFPASLAPASVSGQEIISVSGPTAVVAAIEETIKRLDVPSAPTTPVEIVVQVLECATSDAWPDQTPPELKDVVAQLKKTFNYSSCAVAETLMTRAGSDKPFEATSHSSKSEEKGGPDWYRFWGSLDVDASQAPVRVKVVDFNLKDSSGTRAFRGDVVVRDGQKAVLGTLGSVGVGRVGVLVLTARVLP